MKFSLVVSQGAQRGKVVPVKQAAFLIGRSSQCHLRPSSPEISDCHCALFSRNGKLYVRDLNSASGTFLNGQRLDGEHDLADGDQLRFGPLRFQVRIDEPPAPTSTEPVQGLARDGDVFVAAPAVAVDNDAVEEQRSVEEIEEEAARALLHADDEDRPAHADTREIALHSAETQPMRTIAPPPSAADSAAAARAILNQYRQRKSGRSVTNR